MKLLADFRDYDEAGVKPEDSMFEEQFVPENRELLRGFRIRGAAAVGPVLQEHLRGVFPSNR